MDDWALKTNYLSTTEGCQIVWPTQHGCHSHKVPTPAKVCKCSTTSTEFANADSGRREADNYVLFFSP